MKKNTKQNSKPFYKQNYKHTTHIQMYKTIFRAPKENFVSLYLAPGVCMCVCVVWFCFGRLSLLCN